MIGRGIRMIEGGSCTCTATLPERSGYFPEQTEKAAAMQRMKRVIVMLGLMAVVGLLAALSGFQVGRAQGPDPGRADTDMHMYQGRATVAEDHDPDYDFGLGDSHVSRLEPYPDVTKGDRTPFDIWRYAGRGKSSYTTTELPMPWEEWLEMNTSRKPELMKEVRSYMNSRFDFSGEAIPGVMMSGGRKAVMAGRGTDEGEEPFPLPTAGAPHPDHRAHGVPRQLAGQPPRA